MSELKSAGKSFEISKWEVWEAWEKVKANQGAPGVDGCSIEEFEKDLKNGLYRVWNRMSSGSYFPPPVRAVEIPKSHGGGTRILGVPTVADRIAQTVVARRLEARTEPVFHPDSYGYRPRRSALHAVETCRRRCWKSKWVIDLDIQKFFDSVPWDLVVKAVRAHTEDRGWGCTSNGGSKRRCSSPTGPCWCETGEPHRDPRYRPCWPICSSITPSSAPRMRKRVVGRQSLGGINALWKMEDCWPSGIVLWGTVSNRHMLRWLKTVVVSDVEKAHLMRQVGARETTAVYVSRV